MSDNTKTFKIRTSWKVEREIVVLVPEGADPYKEADWIDILHEDEQDQTLFEVESNSAEEVDYP